MGQLVNYEYLRNLGNKPRVHPNGFLQLDIAEGKKLHIWPDVPFKTVDVETPMHDHTFSFTSTVILGELKHTIYDLVEAEEGLYRLYTVFPYKAIDREDPFSLLDDKRYNMEIREEITIKAGETYSFEAFEFHSSHAKGLTATLIITHPFDKSRKARVTCRHDQYPQFFKRDQFDEEFLWSIIRKVFPY